MGWVDTIVLTIVIIFGLVIFYKALKEPMDLLFGWIKSLFSSFFGGGSEEEVSKTITYG